MARGQHSVGPESRRDPAGACWRAGLHAQPLAELDPCPAPTPPNNSVSISASQPTYQGRVACLRLGLTERIFLLRSPLPVPPGGWGREPGTERAAATAAGIRRGLLRHVKGPPGSMTQASGRGQCLTRLRAFVAYSGCEWARECARGSSGVYVWRSPPGPGRANPIRSGRDGLIQAQLAHRAARTRTSARPLTATLGYERP